MAQVLNLKCKGLYTHPNELGSVPEGALLRAENCSIDREDILETRRGTYRVGAALANLPTALFIYKNRILVYHGTTLSYDADGSWTWTDYTGAFSPPTGRKIRSFEANQNFYFTTSTGIKKLSSLTGTPIEAGIPRGLDGAAALNAGGGFLPKDNQAAYRVVWGLKDSNGNLVLGAPSQRFVVINPASGAAKNVDISFTVPSDITTSHIYQVYRSPASGGEDIEPNDELQLAYEGNPTADQVAQRRIPSLVGADTVFTDITIDSLLGATIYTAPSQEGIENANDRPPLAKDVAVYRNHAIYANVESNQSSFLTLIGVGTVTGGLFYYSPTGTVSNGSPTITSVSSFTGLAVGMLVTGTDIPANTKILSMDTGASTITMDKNATGVGAADKVFRSGVTIDGVTYWANSTQVVGSKYFKAFSGVSVADNIEDTAQSLAAVINQSGADVAAYYMSGYDELPGKLWIRDKAYGGAAWAMTSTYGSAFSPVLPASGSTVSSSSDAKKNRLFVAKPGQPEAVPLGQFFDAGSADKEIYRVIALRDSVFIEKEDGMFRMTGSSLQDFQVSQFDNTAILVGIETSVPLNNQAFGYSTQGAVAVSDNGVQVSSRPIENDLTALSGDQIPNFRTIAHAVAYETERKFILFVPELSTDTYATMAYVYNTFTNAWTSWRMPVAAAIVNPADDRLYFAAGNEKYVRRGRKDFAITDYANDEYAVTIVGYTGTTVELASTSDAVVGQTLFVEEQFQAIVTEVVDATHVEVDREIEWTAGSAKLYDPIPISIEWIPVHGGNPGVVKQFPEIAIFFKEAMFKSIDLIFGTSFARDKKAVTVYPVNYTSGMDDEPFGEGPFGGSSVQKLQPIRTFIPLEQQRSTWLGVSIEHEEACTKFSMAGAAISMNPMETRFR